MLKFIFITDTHFRADKPKSRIDDTYKAQFDELGEIASIINENSVSFVVHGGDFFNTRSPSLRLVSDLINWCKYVDCPIYVTVGNHDVLGYNLDSVTNSGLGVLFEADAAEKLTHRLFEEEKVYLGAVHTSLTFKDEYQVPKEYEDYTKILVSHNYVIPSEDMPFEFVHPKDITSNADLVLCGHYHVPFDYTNGNTRWINPGALSRWSVSEKHRKPTVLLVSVENGKVDVKPIELTSSKSGDEIFDVANIDKSNQREKEIEEFVSSLEATSFDQHDIEQLVRSVGAEKSIDQVVIKRAVDAVREAKEKADAI